MRLARRFGTLLLGLLPLVTPDAAHAQIAAPSDNAITPAIVRDEPRTRRTTRLYVGMWTTHLKDDAIVLDNNWVIGLAARGFFGATFENSYGRRVFSGGLQRTILASEPRPVGASLGFRLGVITGYDGRLMRMARNTPVMPLIQPFATIDVKRIGIEVSYTFVVVSVAVSYGL